MKDSFEAPFSVERNAAATWYRENASTTIDEVMAKIMSGTVFNHDSHLAQAGIKPNQDQEKSAPLYTKTQNRSPGDAHENYQYLRSRAVTGSYPWLPRSWKKRVDLLDACTHGARFRLGTWCSSRLSCFSKRHGCCHQWIYYTQLVRNSN